MKNKTLVGVYLAMYLLGFGAKLCLGQEGATQPEPPKFIHIIQDVVKEGSWDAYHDLQVERAKALFAANWPRVSIALKTITGPDLEVLHMSFFNSFEERANDKKEMGKNPALSAKLKELTQKESLLLQSRREIDVHYQPKISYQGNFNWADMRFMSIINIHLKPGHGSEYLQNRDIVMKAHSDAKLPENLAIYTVFSGALSSTYLIMRPVTSLKGFDETEAMHGDAYGAILGDENRKKVHDLFAASVETEEEDYFGFDHLLSYTTPAWAGSNSDYWKPTAQK